MIVYEAVKTDDVTYHSCDPYSHNIAIRIITRSMDIYYHEVLHKIWSKGFYWRWIYIAVWWSM